MGATSLTGSICSESSKSLTPRERQVVKGICGGMSYKEIAYSMMIQKGTIKSHMTSIFNKVGVRTKTQIAIWYIRENEL